jgi:nucleoside-diphosphate-sugar epimerase
MRNILITGGSGFIGNHLVKRLLHEERSRYKILVIDNLSNNKVNSYCQNYNGKVLNERKAEHTSHHNGNQVSFYKADIRDKDTILKIFNRERIDTCIHLAAKIGVYDSITNPYETLDTNIKGTLNILEACSKNNVKNFVFASSAAVYGKAKKLPISEDHVAIEPLSPYGASKIAAEALISSYRNMKKIQKAVSLRFFNVYGENQNNEYAGVITKFAMRLSKGLPPIIYGDGKQTRDFVFVGDVVNAIIMSAKSNKDRDALNVFNIGTGIPIRINDLALRMIKIFGFKLHPIYRKPERGDIKESYADLTKSKKILKFNTRKDFDEGLREVIRSYAFRK